MKEWEETGCDVCLAPIFNLPSHVRLRRDICLTLVDSTQLVIPQQGTRYLKVRRYTVQKSKVQEISTCVDSRSTSNFSTSCSFFLVLCTYISELVHGFVDKIYLITHAGLLHVTCYFVPKGISSYDKAVSNRSASLHKDANY